MKFRNKEIIMIGGMILIAGLIFTVLYRQQSSVIEKPQNQEESALVQWDKENSSINQESFREDKSIYPDTPDVSIHDTYITIFPTDDVNGNTLDFSAFGKHQSRDHTYNPVLDCNVQILGENKTPDSLVNLDVPNATIRVRGNSSRGDTFKSYKVKLQKDTEGFYGQYSLNINKHSEDVAKIATKLCTDLLTDIDNTASFQTYFMRVWIRDASLPKENQKFEYYGLYTQIEQPNKTYLEKRGLGSNASVYKARDFSFQMSDLLRNIDNPNYNVEEFEQILGIREATDHTALLEMIAAVNDTTRSFEDIFSEYFNEENYLTWLAFNLLLGNNDIINHNFILYHPENSQKWYFIPWDFDGTLQFGKYESSLMLLPESLKGAQKLNQSIMHRRYLRMPGSLDKIIAKMQELLKENVTEAKVKELTSYYMPILEKTMPLYPDIQLLEMPPNELPEYIDQIYGSIEENYQEFMKAMEYPSPMYVSKPEKNLNGTMHFAWEVAHSYQGRTVTYHVVAAKDYNMQEVVFEEKDIISTTLDTPAPLEKGTYYLKVTAVDSAGNEQLSMERFETMLTERRGLNVNGVLQFTVE